MSAQVTFCFNPENVQCTYMQNSHSLPLPLSLLIWVWQNAWLPSTYGYGVCGAGLTGLDEQSKKIIRQDFIPITRQSYEPIPCLILLIRMIMNGIHAFIASVTCILTYVYRIRHIKINCIICRDLVFVSMKWRRFAYSYLLTYIVVYFRLITRCTWDNLAEICLVKSSRKALLTVLNGKYCFIFLQWSSADFCRTLVGLLIKGIICLHL